jgi:DNA ligase-associated metallophosphoesterase
MSAADLAVSVAGRELLLCPEHAAFDPAAGTLLVADPHFGKGAVFRARGIPVPGGTTADNLARLDTLLARLSPARLVFLGDLLHAREAQGPSTAKALAAWRARHPRLAVTLVAGNHDRHAGPPGAALAIDTVAEPWRHGPWALCHHPQTVPGHYALAGHEHPVYRLQTGADRLRLPCFRFGAAGGTLPAFGSFTGGFVVNDSAAGDAIFVVAGERIIAVPHRRAPSGR